jgi:tRNA 5-methylaminomethyl-2-thiouridine biosynthesis bifunctional protein
MLYFKMRKNLEIFDAIIIGGGIAGASTAYTLNENGFKVLLLEQTTVCRGDSNAAGAFISPKISRPSPYKEYLNRAFSYTTNLYKKSFSKLFNQCTLLKLPLDCDDLKRLKSYEPYIDLNFSKEQSGYRFFDAGIIDPCALIEQMLKDVEVLENYKVAKTLYEDDLWRVDKFLAKYLIFATGSQKPPLDLPYIKTKKVGGYRYDLSFEGMQTLDHNIHKDISISAFQNGKVIIGATHIRGDVDLEDAAKNDSYSLLQKAQKIFPIHNPKILKHYTGYRLATYDYFPVVGQVIDHKATLEKYPYISKGTKVPSSRYIYYPNLYIHTALGSRGFVFAPYNAMLLMRLITENEQNDKSLSTVRLFRRWARRTLF